MCTSYEANPNDAWDVFSLFPVPQFEYRREIYKDYYAPVLRRAETGFETVPASFGIVPRRHILPGVKVFDTMNARSESIDQKRSFSSAWKNLQLALIPCLTFFEPSYETGKPVRWKIGAANGEPLAIAGLWRQWKEVDGSLSLAFTMLTLNADEHPLMKRFHKPGDEKRSVVIVPPAGYADWLSCKTTDEARSFLQLYPADAMRAEAYPLPPRKPAANAPEEDQAPLL
ncbi:Putative SOS response-associated peptidase YedK [Paraburkholderia steynii]|uniref:Abasic site processing protein n=1 Tax=Paraburkholderia steynii TaxID=1245441 RepID=A0A7Z7BKY3_9BURK|nr:SOS response-associated peptidase family protein [Paraburkholderia steynii]SDJ49082.1 Putative SOS response-associated peptidase YedK [Paraburkholderia steynii]